MQKLSSNIGLKKGDVIAYTEISKISHGAGTKDQYFEDVEFKRKFEITRVNPKTYTCKYIEGAYKGSGFKWIKTDILNSNKEYFLTLRATAAGQTARPSIETEGTKWI